jgi:hypothetical protein
MANVPNLLLDQARSQVLQPFWIVCTGIGSAVSKRKGIRKQILEGLPYSAGQTECNVYRCFHCQWETGTPDGSVCSLSSQQTDTQSYCALREMQHASV